MLLSRVSLLWSMEQLEGTYGSAPGAFRFFQFKSLDVQAWHLETLVVDTGQVRGSGGSGRYPRSRTAPSGFPRLEVAIFRVGG